MISLHSCSAGQNVFTFYFYFYLYFISCPHVMSSCHHCFVKQIARDGFVFCIWVLFIRYTRMEMEFNYYWYMECILSTTILCLTVYSSNAKLSILIPHSSTFQQQKKKKKKTALKPQTPDPKIKIKIKLKFKHHRQNPHKYPNSPQ